VSESFYSLEGIKVTKERKLTLSKRLLTVASFIDKNSYFIDIGSDHAYLPSYVCDRDSSVRAIASEVNKGPFESAERTVKQAELTDVIDVRLGDGLDVVTKNDEIDTIVIAGMGGSLIRSILDNGKSNIHTVETIIAQPNIDARSVRKWLVDHHYGIVAERLVEENKFIYEVIVAKRTKHVLPLTEEELLLGPLLLKEKSPLFYTKWQSELENKEKILSDINKATTSNEQKKEQFEKEIHWIKEAIHHDSRNE